MRALAARPVDVVPARPQTLWGWPAAANFCLGGLGAGLYVVAVALDGLDRSPGVAVASWLGPALVLAGFAAVATEAGHPFRGARVLRRVRTSWMSRELWLGGVFALLVAADLWFPLAFHRAQAATVALLFVLAQGFILRRARAVPAWDVPSVPLVFLASALVSGAGLWALLAAVSGRAPAAWQAGALAAAPALGLVVWVGYLGGAAGAFARAVAPLREGRLARLIVGGGYVAPLALATLALVLPALGPLALGLAGALMVLGQVVAKTHLIRTAGQLRPLTLHTLRWQRRTS
jgi:formate-dependent nitrite reductase membrane component NrfD